MTNPASPRCSPDRQGPKDTHKNWWECDTGIAYLVSGVPGWRTRRMTQVYDLCDPANPSSSATSASSASSRARKAGADRTARRDLDRSAGQPRRCRLRHQQGRRDADRRSREAHQRPEGADAGQPAYRWSASCTCRRWSARTRRYPLGKVRIPEFAKDKFGAERNMVMIVDESLVNECGTGESRQRRGSSMPRSRKSRWWCRTTRRRGGDFCGAAAASARIRRTRAWRRCSAASSLS